MKTHGQHLTLDVWLQPVDVEFTADEILSYISNTFKVVKSAYYDFEPQGRTEVLILSESHFTVHTYPEENYLSMDLYICNMEADLKKVAEDICNLTSVAHAKYEIKKRGIR